MNEVSIPPNVLLSGIVGSTAYGLATEDSDVDRLGVFAAPTERLVGLHPPQPSVVSSKPDATFHEAGKFAALALKVNPTITELMWLPDDLYETRTGLGSALIAAAFLVVATRRLLPGGIQCGWRFTALLWLALLGCLAHARFDFPFQIYSIVFLFLVLCAILSNLSRPAAAP